MDNLEGEIHKQLKFRDIKRFFKRVQDEFGNDVEIGDMEDYIKAKLISIIIESITDEPAFKTLLRMLVKEIEDAL